MSRVLGVAALAAAVAFAWWEGGLHQSSNAAHVGILVAIALGFAGAGVAGRDGQTIPSAQWARGPLAIGRHYAASARWTIAVVVWIVVILAPIGWDLNSFAHQSHNLPTLSSIFGHLTSTHGGRAAMVAAWLVLGTTLATRWRRPA